ncbi:MAG: DUF86 domain-containing protein [Tannerella sp.]|jgi:uncharacterized protein with HEPN domain|nr:DUF86 domain-containing protein [Tannerella sp.]
MYDRTLTLETLQHIEETLCMLIEGTATIGQVDELLASPDGILRLNGICMILCVVGEEIKNLDKHTDKKLLPDYPSIPWKDVMKMRDVIAHHYFEVDAEKVFDTLRNDVPPLLTVLRQMRKDLDGGSATLRDE